MALRSVASIVCLFLSAATSAYQKPVVPQFIQDVRVFDGERILEHRSVVLENGNITRIGGSTLEAPKTAEIIAGKDRTLLPGFIDAHVHIADDAEGVSRQALQLGVTTQLDMFNAGDRLSRIKKLESEDRTDLADVRTAGVGASVPGGHPSQMGGPPIPTITAPDQAQAFVDARIAEGSDYIKIIHDDGSTWTWNPQRVPMLDNATMRALIEAAHKRGKLAVVHVLSEQQARDAIAAGADGLAHMFIGESVTADFGKFVASHQVFVIATLSALYGACGKSEGPAVAGDAHLAPYIAQQWRSRMDTAQPDASKNRFCQGSHEGMHQLIQAHVPILAGTDAPLPGTTYGASLHSELELLVREGLTPLQALAAATSVAARCFHLADRGQIRPGMRADLLLVEGNPTQNILATRNIVAVWKRGIRVHR